MLVSVLTNFFHFKAKNLSQFDNLTVPIFHTYFQNYLLTHFNFSMKFLYLHLNFQIFLLKFSFCMDCGFSFLSKGPTTTEIYTKNSVPTSRIKENPETSWGNSENSRNFPSFSRNFPGFPRNFPSFSRNFPIFPRNFPNFPRNFRVFSGIFLVFPGIFLIFLGIFWVFPGNFWFFSRNFLSLLKKETFKFSLKNFLNPFFFSRPKI